MKKIITVFILLFILLLVAGCTAPVFELTEENILNEPDRAIKVCKSKEDTEMFDCFADVGTTLIKNGQSQKALAICEAVPVNIRDFCYSEVAKKAGSAIPCLEIKESADSDDCLADVAKKTKDHEICEGISESSNADDCYYAICSSEGNVEACKGISDEIARNDILYELAVRNEDADLCKEITGQIKRGICQYDIAVALGDASICRQIESSGKKSECLDDIGKAVVTTDVDNAMAACAGMTQGKDDCYWNIVDVTLKKDSKKTIEVCNNIESGSDDCLLDITRHWWSVDTDKAFEACKEMGTQPNKNNCVEEMVSTEDSVKVDPDGVVAVCEISNDKDYCYKLLAVTLEAIGEKSKAKSVCSKMKDDWERGQCQLKYR